MLYRDYNVLKDFQHKKPLKYDSNNIRTKLDQTLLFITEKSKCHEKSDSLVPFGSIISVISTCVSRQRRRTIVLYWFVSCEDSKRNNNGLLPTPVAVSVVHAETFANA